LLKPLLISNGVNIVTTNLNFFLLTLSVVLLTAAGYIINDVNDVSSDMVNKPEKVIIGKYIGIRPAENIYLVLNFLAIGIGVYISFTIGLRSVSMAFLLVAGLLYFYSTTYKSQLILGNIIVAIFASLVPIMVVLFELPLLKMKYKTFLDYSNFNFNFIIAWFGFYAIFAFIINLIREIIKDIEDFEGDRSYGYNTLPIAIGVKFSKLISFVLIAILLTLILYCLFIYLYNPVSIIYISIFIILPILFLIYKLAFANSKVDYSIASNICKLIMLAGVFYVLIVKLLVLK
jgi:4-hydroxybenzoate polyprenyltransferase